MKKSRKYLCPFTGYKITAVFFFGTIFFLYTPNEQTFEQTNESFGEVLQQRDVPYVDIPKVTEDVELCQGKGIRPKGKVPTRMYTDILQMDKLNFLPDYKNPCFKRNTISIDTKTSLTTNRTSNGTWDTIRCLPYFFIIGMPKSGTSDLWDKLAAHPDVYAKHQKEPMWFNRRRFQKQAFEDYLDQFSKATKVIERGLSPSTCHSVLPYHHIITGEGTVDVSFDNSHWRQLPGNEGCNEPLYTNPHYLRHIIPNAKLIVMMRNPVDRVFSDYMYESQFFGYKKSIEDFHMAVLESMSKHLDCRRYFTHRGCAYNASIESFKARLRVGMYSVFLEDWLRVFPREQMLVILFEDYKRDSKKIFKLVLKYLDLRPLTDKELRPAFRKPILNTRSKKDRKLGDMLPKTRYLLNQFYKPFNIKLATLLKDERFLWND